MQVQNRLFTKNWLPRTEILLVSFLMCYFSYHPSIAASETRSLTTLFSTKTRGEETVTKISTYLSFKFVVETIRHYCILVKSFI